MRKIYISVPFIAILFCLASLSNKITETREIAIQNHSKGPCVNNEFSKSSNNDACSGCHGSSTSVSPGGYVIIIYANGKTGSGIKLNPGVNDLLIYNSVINEGAMASQMTNQGVDVTVNTNANELIDVDKFTSIHGAESINILNHLSHVKAITNEEKSFEVIATKNILVDFTALFNNTSMLLNVNSSTNTSIQVSLFDMTGKAYIENAHSMIVEGENQISFETNTPLARGIYIVKMVDEVGNITSKKVFID